MKYLYFPLLLLCISSLCCAQSVVPYDLSWEKFHFSKAYSKVERLTATTYGGKRDLRRGFQQQIDEVFFDEYGRSIHEKLNFFSNTLQCCWKYASDGCPELIRCGIDSIQKIPNPFFTCHAGQIDTIYGDLGSFKVKYRDELGRESIAIQYQKDMLTGAYQLLDSIQTLYDENGRCLGYIGLDSKMVANYLNDSIKIETYEHGLLQSTLEIKCGRFGLPVVMQKWVYSDHRNRKKRLDRYSIIDYVFRE